MTRHARPMTRLSARLLGRTFLHVPNGIQGANGQKLPDSTGGQNASGSRRTASRTGPVLGHVFGRLRKWALKRTSGIYQKLQQKFEFFFWLTTRCCANPSRRHNENKKIIDKSYRCIKNSRTLTRNSFNYQGVKLCQCIADHPLKFCPHRQCWQREGLLDLEWS